MAKSTKNSFPLNDLSKKSHSKESDEHVTPGRGLSFISATVFIIGEVAGVGILTLPKALEGTGWSGIVLMLLCCTNAGIAGICLANCWLILEERWPQYRYGLTRKPYAEIGSRSYGKWASIAVSINMNVTRFGASVVVLLLSSELIESITKELVPELSLCKWVPIVCAALTPLVWLGSPADFWPAAYTAMLSTLVGSVLLLIEIITDASKKSLKHTEFQSPTFATFFMAFGNIIFSYGGASAFPNFQNDMKDKSQFPKAVMLGFASLLFLYIPVAGTGYAVYGKSVNTNILQNLNRDWFAKLITGCFAVHSFFAFLIVLNPTILDIEELVKVPKKFCWQRVIFRTIMMVLILFTGATVPDFGRILDLIGSTTMTVLCFIMPPAFYLKLCSQTNDNKWSVPFYKKAFYMQIIVVGVLGGIASTYSSILDWATSSTLSPPCYMPSYANNTLRLS